MTAPLLINADESHNLMEGGIGSTLGASKVLQLDSLSTGLSWQEREWL